MKLPILYIQDIIKFSKNHFVLITIWISLFIILVVNFIRQKLFRVNEITNREAIQLINKKEAIILDFRNKKDYFFGHIIGSINLRPDEIECKFRNKLNLLKDNPIIVTSASGISSFNSAKKLTKLGFMKVYILKDGIIGWNQDNLPLVRKNNNFN